MYKEAFDQFFESKTWAQLHVSDDERFFVALHTVVEDPAFRHEDLQEYMVEKCGLEPENELVEHYVGLAETVSRYVRANR